MKNSDLLAQAKELLTVTDAWSKLGLPGEPKRSCRSPFRDERNASFSVFDEGRAWKDYATNKGGSVVDFIREALDCELAEAIRVTIQLAGLGDGTETAPAMPRTRQLVKAAPLQQVVAIETLREWGRIQAEAVKRLAEDSALIERLAESRGWQTETIRALAMDGFLGWHEGALAFLYDHGMKTRRKAADGARVIRWLFGGNGELWRGFLLKIQAYRHCRVLICEGETDAITAIDAGLEADRESETGGRLVVALPCANAWNGAWLSLLAGREITLALDGDEAGQKAAASLAEKLSGFAKAITIINPQNLLNP